MTDYKKRKCVKCGASVNQRAAAAARGDDPLCSQHAWEQRAREIADAYDQFATAQVEQVQQVLAEDGIKLSESTRAKLWERFRGSR